MSGSVNWSYAIKRATDTIFLENMLGTSIGILVGFVADGLAAMAGVAWPGLAGILAAVWLPFWLCAGVVPFAVWTYTRRPKTPVAVESALAEIRYSRRRGDITDAQARTLSIQVLSKYVENILENDINSSNRTRRVDGGADLVRPDNTADQ